MMNRYDCYDSAVEVIETEVRALQQVLASQKNDRLAYKKRLDACDETIAATEAKIAACHQTISVLREPCANGPSTAEYGKATSDDITRSLTIHEALVRMARINDSPVDLREAADFWIKATNSTSVHSSVLSSFRRSIRKSGVWRKVRPGIYELAESVSAECPEGAEPELSAHHGGIISEDEETGGEQEAA